ncbi:hypothetical protein NKT77_00840 [Moraxella sp. FZLJ2107]|uniref:hypothetical protein n=1 Tax=unclassified Moraxella TaxID=2685852 RepID=UPI0020C89D1B|nr:MULTISPECIES: hypothetical protein [unclassified Moraxella]UTO06230.1 hypothetical protein NKT77_00840 [Moraxella sp. FZLJ2107]UTO23535.1 hypothetical protein NKU06_09140 [Moraxella sp. FZLJ2109]
MFTLKNIATACQHSVVQLSMMPSIAGFSLRSRIKKFKPHYFTSFLTKNHPIFTVFLSFFGVMTD